jgi:hypothetical protein
MCRWSMKNMVTNTMFPIRRLGVTYVNGIQIPPEPLATHRAEIMSLQHQRSFASSCKSCVFILKYALSLMMVLRSVSLGLPRLLVPIGVQLKGCPESLLLPILNTCPRYFQRRLFIKTSSCFVSSLNVLFDLNSFQCVSVIFLRHLFSKAFSFSSVILVDFYFFFK